MARILRVPALNRPAAGQLSIVESLGQGHAGAASGSPVGEGTIAARLVDKGTIGARPPPRALPLHSDCFLSLSPRQKGAVRLAASGRLTSTGNRRETGQTPRPAAGVRLLRFALGQVPRCASRPAVTLLLNRRRTILVLLPWKKAASPLRPLQ